MDETMIILENYVTNGWPENKKLVNQLVAPYYNVRGELYKLKGIILKLNRIIIPKSLRKQILNNLHEAHGNKSNRTFCKNLRVLAKYFQ